MQMQNEPMNMGAPQADNEYVLQILAPPNVPIHKIIFDFEANPFAGRHITEHTDQKMIELNRDGDRFSWKAYGGSRGDEVFLYEMKLFHGGVMLGSARRVDAGEGQPESPVVCKSTVPDTTPGQQQ